MNVKQWASYVVGVLVLMSQPPVRSERGLSQSAENAILLAGAALVAGIIIRVMTVYVTKNMPK